MNLLPLLHLCDSLFPVGAFAYSDGLETAAGRAAPPFDAAELRAWIDVCLDETLGRMEGPAVWQAWTAFRNTVTTGTIGEPTASIPDAPVLSSAIVPPTGIFQRINKYRVHILLIMVETNVKIRSGACDTGYLILVEDPLAFLIIVTGLTGCPIAPR